MKIREKKIINLARVYRTCGYRLTLHPDRFLVVVGYDQEELCSNNDPLPDWIFDSEYVMWLVEGPEPIHERAMAGAWIKMLVSTNPAVKIAGPVLANSAIR